MHNQILYQFKLNAIENEEKSVYYYTCYHSLIFELGKNKKEVVFKCDLPEKNPYSHKEGFLA